MLTIVYAFNFIDRQILVILQEPIKADMGLSDAQLGLLSGFSFALIYVTAGIPIAYWADRGNRRNIVSLALAVWSGMTALSAFTQNYGQLLAARIGVGLGEAGGSPPAHSMISDYYPPEQRGRALSFYSTGIYVGILIGFMFGGVIAEAFGWRTAFLVVGIPGVLFAVFLRFAVKEPIRGRWDTAAESTHKPTLSETMTLLRQRPSFWYIAVGCSLTAFVSYGVGNFFPSFLMRSHGMSIGQVGVVLALVSGVTGAAGTYLGGYLGDRFGAADARWYLWVPMIGGAVAFVPYLYVLLTANTTGLLVVLVFTNLLTTLYLGPCIALSHALVPPSMRALTSAILFFVLNMIGLGLGPFLTGLMSDLLAPQYGEDSLRYAMVISSMLGLVAIAMFYIGARKLPADLAKRQSDRETSLAVV
ncbi:MFS transporter [Kineobactrum sediminis]|uniref:MFS transporter n=2 Tax=Kineobactrum sediminis TaxID=1905677 RepID=A0A2N5Y370_9GAMM|nr:MFS transporter [Kineobactrum sediminis]